MKVVLIGDSEVGKSALFTRIKSNEWIDNSAATVGIAFAKVDIRHPCTGKSTNVQVWDTAGQEKFRSITVHHYRATDGALLVCDVTSRRSFDSVAKWPMRYVKTRRKAPRSLWSETKSIYVRTGRSR